MAEAILRPEEQKEISMVLPDIPNPHLTPGFYVFSYPSAYGSYSTFSLRGFLFRAAYSPATHIFVFWHNNGLVSESGSSAS
jgi:hypothetical protein